MVHRVGSYYTSISRCTFRKTLNVRDLSLYLIQQSYTLILSVFVPFIQHVFLSNVCNFLCAVSDL
jgi:hypothetical protein